MDVAAAAVGIQHLLIPAIERADAQLNLGEIAGYQNAALGRDDEGADANGIVGLARRVLHIGVPGRKSPGFRCQRQHIRMNPARRRIDEAEVSVQVCGL